MASDVDICNLSLSYLGDRANISAIDPSDGSHQSDLCVRFYPIARDALLAMHAWSFATKRVALALRDADDEQPQEWDYCYAVPNDCVNVISILPQQGSGAATLTSFPPDITINTNASGDENTQEFVQETLQDGTPVIFTNIEDAKARYTVRVSDTTKFKPLFITALARFLASMLSGPILKGETGIKVGAAHAKSFYQVELPFATVMDQKGQKKNVYKNFVPDSLAARA